MAYQGLALPHVVRHTTVVVTPSVTSRSYKTNFGSYIAQRAKQPYMPRGTVGTPRRTRPGATSAEVVPIVSDKLRRQENRMQLQKFLRAPLEMYADTAITSDFRLPDDEKMPLAQIYRPDATHLGEETLFDEDDVEGEDDDPIRTDIETRDEETYVDEAYAKLTGDELDGEDAEQKLLDELELEAAGKKTAAGAAVKPLSNDAEVSEQERRELEQAAQKEVAEDDLWAEDNYDPAKPPRRIEPVGYTPDELQELAEDKEIPVPKGDLSPQHAARLVSNTYRAFLRTEEMHTDELEAQASKLIRNPLEEAVMGDPTVVRDVLEAGYEDYDDVPAASFEEEAVLQMKKEEKLAELKARFPGIKQRELIELLEETDPEISAEMLLALHAHAGTKAPRQFHEELEDERLETYAAVTGEGEELVDKELERLAPRDSQADAPMVAEAKDAELNVADQPDVFAGVDEETAEEIRAAVERKIAEEQAAQRGFMDLTDPQGTKQMLERLETDSADAGEDVQLKFTGQDAVRMVEIMSHNASKNIEEELEEEEMAKQADNLNAITENIQRVKAIRAQHIKDEAEAGDYLNTGPLAGTYAAAKAADMRLREREINARVALGDPTLLSSALVREHLRRGRHLEEQAGEEEAKLPEDAAEDALDDNHDETLERLSAQEMDFLGPAEVAESRFENAMLNGDIARAAAIVDELQADSPEQDYDEEDDVAHVEEMMKKTTPQDLKAGRREYLLTLESMRAILDPKSVPQDNPVAKYMKYGNQPGYEDLGTELYNWATDGHDPEQDITHDEEDDAYTKVRQDKSDSILRSLVARGHLPLFDAKQMARNPFDYIFAHASPRKTDLLRSHYLDHATRPSNENALDRRQYSDYMLSQMQETLRDALLGLQTSLMSMNEKKKIAAGIASDLNDIDAALLARKESSFANVEEIYQVRAALMDLHTSWASPEDDIKFHPQDLLFAPQEMYRIPDNWRRNMQRPHTLDPEGHLTRGRINFRRKGEFEYERYNKWRTDALEFVSDRILRDKERTRVAASGKY